MLYQHTHFGTSEYFCKEYGENFSFPVHLHHSFEFITVLSGEMTVTVDNTVYALKQGDCVLIFPDQLHGLQSKKSRHMLCIFSPKLVHAYYTKISEKVPQSNIFPVEPAFISAIDKLSPDASTIEKKGLLYCLCAAFEKNSTYSQRVKASDNLLHQIFTFVEESFTADCDLSKLSHKIGYSYSYLSRCFKKTTGISFNAYVNQYRISHACYLLNNTNHSILQCALDCGFGSLRSFNRNFTETVGMTPSKYRKKK